MPNYIAGLLLLICFPAFGQVVTAGNDGYNPRANECSVSVHKQYTTKGQDGLTYYTWHPPVHTLADGKACPFGHEHGDNPALSKIPDYRMPALGAIAHAATSQDLLQHLHEDHVGFKVFAENDIAMKFSGIDVKTHAIITFHQGGHGPNAFSANLHEQTYQFYAAAGGKVLDVDAGLLSVVGQAGVLDKECSRPTGKVDTYASVLTDVRVNPLVPGKSPGTRVIPFADCVEVSTGQDRQEAWRTNEVVNGPGAAGKQTAFINPSVYHFMSPGRYYTGDPADPLAYYVDSCYLTTAAGAPLIRSAPCPNLRRDFPGGLEPTSTDAPKEFKACLRTHRITGLAFLANALMTDWYTDSRGWNAKTTPFPGSIKQHMRNDFGAIRISVAKAFKRDFCDPTIHLPN